MLRFVLALALAAVVGAIGYWFWQQSLWGRMPSGAPVANVRPADQTRDRMGPEPRMETVPEIKTSPTAPPGATLPSEENLPPAPGADEAVVRPLLERRLSPPLSNLKPADVQDTFYQSRGGGERRHEAADIMAPRGTPVLAMDDGIVVKLFNSKPGGLTIYQFDSANAYCFYYAHLDRYAQGVAEGRFVRKGTTIGYVGSTGNADINAPHLHFAIFELGREKHWWEGNKPVNPYPLLMDLARRRP